MLKMKTIKKNGFSMKSNDFSIAPCVKKTEMSSQLDKGGYNIGKFET